MAMNEQINADADRKTMLYINVEYLNLNESLSRKQTNKQTHSEHRIAIRLCVDSVSLNLIDSKFIRALLILVHSEFVFWSLYN